MRAACIYHLMVNINLNQNIYAGKTFYHSQFASETFII